MNQKSADVYIERLDSLYNDILDHQQDLHYSLKKTRNELWGCYSDLFKGSHKTSDLLMWLKYCREEMGEVLSLLQQMADALDEIGEEITDEINNADREGMFPLP